MLTFKELSEKYLSWCKVNKAMRTHEFYNGHLGSLKKFLADKADEPADKMIAGIINEWTDSHHETWGDNHKRNAVVAANTLYNWGVDSGYLEKNPIKKAAKPRAVRRKTYTTPEVFDKLINAIDPRESFHDFVMFMWIVGCRPQEARAIEWRHVDVANKRIVFPVKESKGKRKERKILMNDEAMAIIAKNMAVNKEGHVFRNSRGIAWTKYAICTRFEQISDKIGHKITSYDLRHGFATRKRKEKHSDLDISKQMGHADVSMLALVYDHASDEDDHVRAIL